MDNLKLKFWDTLEKKYFRPSYNSDYTKITELVVTASGEIYLHELEEGVHKLTHQATGRYIKQVYAGVRDNNQVKYFFGDIVKTSEPHPFDGSQPDTIKYGVLVWMDFTFGIQYGDVALSCTDLLLMSSENVGSIYSDPALVGANPNHDIEEPESIRTLRQKLSKR